MLRRVSTPASFLILFVCLTLPVTAVFAETVSTSFEDDPDGDFTIGTSPITATFANGEAQTVGDFALYRTGTHSWHVGAGVTGLITFETPASDVDLWFRNAPDAGPSEVRVLDVDGAVLSSTTGSQSFQNVAVSRGQGETLIASVEVENSGSAGDLVVDDFSFTAEEVSTGGPLEDPIPESIPAGVEIQLTTIASGLVAPNWATHAPGDMTRIFVVDQTGILYAIDLATMQSSTFLDVSARLVELGAFGPQSFDERGFLGVAFHPDYMTNGLLYTYTSEPVAGAADFSTIPAGESANHQSVIVEWQVPAPGDPTSVVDPASAREILRVDQPQFNHNGGALEFDANGFLLIAFGDGGNADDQGIGHGTDGNGQDPSNPLGSLLRIDPLGNGSANGQYGIPSTNPFIGQAGFIDETFAYGFRNPFRIAYDAQSGDLFVADVGQNDIEEIDLVTVGENYGWNHKEGSFFFDPNGDMAGFVTDVDPGVPAGLVDPIAEYDHDEGIAIVGGFVYREGSIPAITTRYVFGDYGGPPNSDDTAGRLFYLDGGNVIREFGIRGQSDLGMFLLGFGRDMIGNVYVLANGTGIPFGDTGVVMRIDPGPGEIGFTADSISVSESDAMATVTVARTGGDSGMASVDYATQAGTATAGEDYTEVSGTLNWADGESGEKTFDVPLSDDTADEPAETFTATLSNVSGADAGATSEVTVTINDDDDPPPTPTPPPVADDDDDDGLFGIGANEPLSLLLLLSVIALRYRRRICDTVKR